MIPGGLRNARDPSVPGLLLARGSAFSRGRFQGFSRYCGAIASPAQGEDRTPTSAPARGLMQFLDIQHKDLAVAPRAGA